MNGLTRIYIFFKFWYEFIPKACSVIEMCQYYTLKEGIAGKFNCFLTDPFMKLWSEEAKRFRQSTA